MLIESYGVLKITQKSLENLEDLFRLSNLDKRVYWHEISITRGDVYGCFTEGRKCQNLYRQKCAQKRDVLIGPKYNYPVLIILALLDCGTQFPKVLGEVHHGA